MSEQNDEQLREFLKRTFVPVSDTELQRDLWPQMLRKVDERPIQWSGFDWALVAVLAVCCCIFPDIIPALLYNL